MPLGPSVLLTSATEVVGGRSRVVLNEAYTSALVASGLIPLILPPVSPAVAAAALGDVAGLVLTGGGEDIAPRQLRGVERVHAVELDADSRLSSIVAETCVGVNSSHHQALGRSAEGVRVVGTSPDGIIEAIEAVDPGWWMVGVQWRAEDLTGTDEDWDRRLFAAFADRVRAACRD